MPRAQIVRYEVAGLEIDRAMIRSLAKELAAGGPAADRIRSRINEVLTGKGGAAAALRRSPLVGANLGLTRDHVSPRNIDL